LACPAINVFTIAWQVVPDVLLKLGEVLVATTGLEFACSQAPLSMKGAIIAFWNSSELSATFGC
jgi:POT family proton-dependent oligopeptide transporter